MTLSATYTSFSDLPNIYLTKRNDGKYDSERTIFSLLATEAYNKLGIPLTYYVISLDPTYSKVFGEDNNKRIVRSFEIMGFFQLPKEDRLWSRMGLEMMDEISCYISKRHFATASTYNDTQTSACFSEYFPAIGDVVISDYNKMIYDIVGVKEEQFNALLSRQHIVEIILRPFRDKHISTSGSPELSGSDLNFGLTF